MKICSRCSAKYSNEYKFCLDDGSELATLNTDSPPQGLFGNLSNRSRLLIFISIVVLFLGIASFIWLRPSAESPTEETSFGLLSTNLRLRGGPTNSAEIIGVHYQGARVRILETQSYDTPDGFSTWYRVEVIEYGCDAQGVLGCGSEGANTGWMNARFIIRE